MKTKRNLALAILGVAVGTAVILTQTAWSDRHHQPFKLEGSWIAKVPGSPLSWTYMLAPSDSSGRRAALTGGFVIGDPTLFGLFPEAETTSQFIGDSVVTSHDTGAFTVLHYGLKKGASGPEIVYIVMDGGAIKKKAPGKLEVLHTLAVYLPAQDQDGDGLPDAGETPQYCLPVPSLDTRLPIVAPCQP
jgi:hypothetical protein